MTEDRTATARQAHIVAEASDSDAIAEAFAMLNGTDRRRRYPRRVADQTPTARGTYAR